MRAALTLLCVVTTAYLIPSRCLAESSSNGDDTSAVCDTDLIDLLFLVDKSTSISPEMFKTEKDIVYKVIGQLNVTESRTHVALTLFANHVHKMWCFNNYTNKATLQEAVKNMECDNCLSGQTVTGEAMQYARTNMFIPSCFVRDWETVPRVVVILTDGKSTEIKLLNKTETWLVDTSQSLRNDAHVDIAAVGVGDFRRSELNNITAPDTSSVFTEHEDEELVKKIHNITQEACQARQKAEENPPVSDPTPEVCKEVIDLVFLLDKSASIKDHQWELEKHFVAEMIPHFDIGESKTHVALTLFANQVRHRWCFERYNSSSTLIEAVERLQCLNCRTGKTAIGKSMQYVREKVLVDHCGVRDETVPKVVVLLTDGKSTEDPNYWRSEAASLRENATIVTVGVGGANLHQIRQIASNKDLVFTAKDFDHLMPKLKAITGATCSGSKIESRCEEDWSFDVFSKRCYRWFKTLISNKDLAKACRQHGAEPATSPDRQIQEFLVVLTANSTQRTWLNLHNVHGVWNWGDHTSQFTPIVDGDFTWWKTGFPKKRATTCAIMMVSRFRKWKNVRCVSLADYICSKPRRVIFS